MNFIWPQALSFLLLIPIYVYINSGFEKNRKKDLVPFGNLDVLIQATKKTNKSDFLKHLPFVLKMLVLLFLIIAISRPTSTILVPVKNTKIMLLIDNSISMEATDIQPTRLYAARETAKKFVKELPGGIQIGLGLFSGNVKILVNPSTDKQKVLTALNSLSLKSLEPGTAIGDALLASSDALSFGEELINNNKILVLITDGEANIGIDPIYAAFKSRKKNITIQAVGIGNPNGTIIRGGILTKLDEFTLKQIAQTTGGEYFNAQNLEDMNKIYSRIKSTIKLIPENKEVTFIPTLISFILLLVIQILRWTKFRYI